MTTGHVEHQSDKYGMVPGTVVHVGETRTEQVDIQVTHFSPHDFSDYVVHDVNEINDLGRSDQVTWVNFTGVHDVNQIKLIGEKIGLDTLVLEDIVETDQRPKMEDYGDYLFITLKDLHYDYVEDEVCNEQVSIILVNDLVITFQESDTGLFNPLKRRLQNGLGRARHSKADYLAFLFMDMIVDDYFRIVQILSDQIENMEDAAAETQRIEQENIEKIFWLKHNVTVMRRYILPVMETTTRLAKHDTVLIEGDTQKYFRDTFDHVCQIMDSIAMFRDSLNGLHDLQLTLTSNKLNEIMKTLTLLSSIFLPLTFIVGVYGMNFKHMPELQWPYGYPAILSVMALIVVGMLLYFRKNHWLK